MYKTPLQIAHDKIVSLRLENKDLILKNDIFREKLYEKEKVIWYVSMVLVLSLIFNFSFLFYIAFM